MRPSALFVITGDPRSSHRPAEAIRVAAGVGGWKKVDLRLYLRGAAVLALGESSQGLVDEDQYDRYWPLIGELGAAVYVQGSAEMPGGMGRPGLRIVAIGDDQLAQLAAESTYVLRF